MNVFGEWKGCFLFSTALLVNEGWVNSFLQQKAGNHSFRKLCCVIRGEKSLKYWR